LNISLGTDAPVAVVLPACCFLFVLGGALMATFFFGGAAPARGIRRTGLKLLCWRLPCVLRTKAHKTNMVESNRRLILQSTEEQIGVGDGVSLWEVEKIFCGLFFFLSSVVMMDDRSR
jgi:hypothetical protein